MRPAAGYFQNIHLASRTKSKCDAVAEDVRSRTGVSITTHSVDADDVPATVALIREIKPQLLINVALPYQDLTLMEACLETGVNYLDTANYEPRDVAKFEYSWQWAYQEQFRNAGLFALLGSGFDPGVTNVFTAWALKHHLTKSIRWTSLTSMAATMARLSPPTSTRKSTSGK